MLQGPKLLFEIPKVDCISNLQKQPPEVSIKKGVLRNSTKFTGKHLCQSLFFNKVPGLTPATSLKKRPWHRYFPVNFVKFLKTPFLTEHLRWLLINLLQTLIYINDCISLYRVTGGLQKTNFKESFKYLKASDIFLVSRVFLSNICL